MIVCAGDDRLDQRLLIERAATILGSTIADAVWLADRTSIKIVAQIDARPLDDRDKRYSIPVNTTDKVALRERPRGMVEDDAVLRVETRQTRKEPSPVPRWVTLREGRQQPPARSLSCV